MQSVVAERKSASSAFFRPDFHQRGALRDSYARVVEPRDEETMVYWLARVAREARLDAKRIRAHIAAAADLNAETDINESVITRFEGGRTLSRELDAIVKGYEDDLGLARFELWERALAARRKWEADAIERDEEDVLRRSDASDEMSEAPRHGEASA